MNRTQRTFRPTLHGRTLALAGALAITGMIHLAPATTVHDRFDEPETLPITRAVLYASGVGFFEHEGQVHGNATVRIMLQTDQINDMLKSMVVMDLDGGTVAGISYAANDPIDRSLKSFGVDLSDNPTLPQLLQQLRGAEVVIHAPDRVEGRILNVESRIVRTNDAPQTEHMLTIVTDRGMRTLPMSTIDTVQLADQRLQSELNQALMALINARDTEQKPVDIRLVGEGTRRVVIGYLVETPVWKTSYRLDLSDDQPYLQGWSIVENTSNNDWQGVRLSLVSGRPISFIQDLYTPLYATRPVVQPQLYASLRPRMYDKGVREEALQRIEAEMRRAPGRERAAGGPPAPSMYAFDSEDAMSDRLGIHLRESGATSIAEAGEIGEFFRFTINHPVHMDRRRSAMLPIVYENVAAEKLSIYNKSVLNKHPLFGAWMENTTDTSLMPGPITIYDDGEYAGDAQIGHLAPGEKRLLSYAVDLDLNIVESNTNSTSITRARLVRGVLEIYRVRRHTTTYIIDSSSSRDRTLMIEHPRHHNRTLVEPAKYEERTDDLYRFVVTIPAGKAIQFIVREDEPLSQTIRIMDRPISEFDHYVRSNSISAEIREALSRAIEIRQTLFVLERDRDEVVAELKEIRDGQERLRRNIETVGADSSLGKRYLTRLSEEEDRIEQLEARAAELQRQIREAEDELETYLVGLRLEV